LDRLAEGETPEEALKGLEDQMPGMAYRQLTAIDSQGRTAAFSGRETLGRHGVAQGHDCVAAGNLLANEDVPRAIIEGFESDHGHHLGDHLVAGLRAGLKAGGEEGALHSAALIVAEGQDWLEINLRIDWTEGDPIEELGALWQTYKPQKAAYVTRATDPAAAPSFGVPGDT